MKPSLSLSSLKDGRWYEYLARFMLGGLATVVTGLISARSGPAVGGIFLALPAIFCASATLIEKHEMRRKREAGLQGRRRGQQAAALDATGAALGSVGMLAFAASFSMIVGTQTAIAFAAALVVWTAGALLSWWLWLRTRSLARTRRLKRSPARGRKPHRD
jgi:Protein of unknown function (DUF3147)